MRDPRGQVLQCHNQPFAVNQYGGLLPCGATCSEPLLNHLQFRYSLVRGGKI